MVKALAVIVAACALVGVVSAAGENGLRAYTTHKQQLLRGGGATEGQDASMRGICRLLDGDGCDSIRLGQTLGAA